MLAASVMDVAPSADKLKLPTSATTPSATACRPHAAVRLGSLPSSQIVIEMGRPAPHASLIARSAALIALATSGLAVMPVADVIVISLTVVPLQLFALAVGVLAVAL